MSGFEEKLLQAIATGFKTLLSEKHLYQSVKIDLGFIDSPANEDLQDSLSPGSGRSPTLDKLKRDYLAHASKPWTAKVRDPKFFPGASPVLMGKRDSYDFELPTIHTYCETCGERWLFNPVGSGLNSIIDENSNANQWFYFGYQCQSCKGSPIRFLVRREENKLQMMGRDPIECIPNPNCLPKSTGKFFSDAMIAHHAGQTLAGIFLLRVFIEQFWRTLPEIQKLLAENYRASGDELGSHTNPHSRMILSPAFHLFHKHTES